MTILQSELLCLLKKFINFLQDHNIRYIAAYGTVLGAARHNGFIPWDDDIDIYMWREDYNLLLQLRKELLRSGCDVISIEDKGYYLPFAKVVDPNTTVWEMKKIPFIIGNFIDIFPLDRFDCTDTEIIEMQKKSKALFFDYQATVSNENLIDAVRYLFTGHKTSMIRAIRQVVYRGRMREDKLYKFCEYEKNYVGLAGYKCACVNMQVGLILKSSWFDETLNLPFEDFYVTVPADYDDYLTRLYGDWRTPPPQNKQKAKHDEIKYYMNLKEKLTLEEVKLRIKKGERLVL